MSLRDTEGFKLSTPYNKLTFEEKASYLQNMPLEMKLANQWCLWKLVGKKAAGKIVLSKVPFQTNGSGAMANNKKTWSSFEDVFSAFEKHKEDARDEIGLHTTGFDGIGFMTGNGFGFADFDHCVKTDLNDENLTCRAFWQGALLRFVNTVWHCFVEYSQSGTGLHAFFRAQAPGQLVKPDGRHTERSITSIIELYTRKHFCAVTGIPFEHPELATDNDLTEDVTEGLNHAVSLYCFKSSSQSSKDKTVEVPDQPSGDDKELAEELLEWLAVKRPAKNKTDWSSVFFHGDQLSDDQSSSDLQLALFLKRYFALKKGNAGVLLAMMNASAYGQREKWQSRPDYRRNTIQVALGAKNSRKKRKAN